MVDPQDFQYNFHVVVEPEKNDSRGVFCKHGRVTIRDNMVLTNSKFLEATIFSFEMNDRNADFWHNASFGKVRKNMLSLIGVSKRKGQVHNKKLILTEKVTKSLKQWSQGKNLTTLMPNKVRLPHDGLVSFMRGILAGAYQAKGLGGYPVINENTIFFVEGVAKISSITQASTNPVVEFVDMMKRLLVNNIPTEFDCFFTLLGLYRSKDAFYRNLTRNPSLYKMETRSDYRTAVAQKVKHLTKMERANIEQEFNSIQSHILNVTKNWSQTLHWTKKVKTTYPNNSPYLKALTAPNVKPYQDDPLSFLRYGRNMHQHPGLLTYQDIEAELINIWHDFLPCIHEALRINNVVVRLVDEMDEVPY